MFFGVEEYFYCLFLESGRNVIGLEIDLFLVVIEVIELVFIYLDFLGIMGIKDN